MQPQSPDQDQAMAQLASVLDTAEDEIGRLIAACGVDERDEVGCLSGGWEFWGDFGLIADRYARPALWQAGVQADRAILTAARDAWHHRAETPQHWAVWEHVLLLTASRYPQRLQA